MRAIHLVASLLAVAASGIAAQSTPPQPSSKPPKSITLTGCVAEDTANAGHYSLQDFSNGTTTYRLTGTDVRKYLGRRVELVGAAQPPKLKIVGGLTPNPNVAAQAGAIDPTKAAMAAQGAEGNAQPGAIEVPVLKVRTVRAVQGDCGPH